MGNHHSSDHDLAESIEQIRGETKLTMSRSGSLTFLEDVSLSDKQKTRTASASAPPPPPTSSPLRRTWIEHLMKAVDQFFYPPIHPHTPAQRQMSVTAANDDTLSVWSATTARSTTLSVMMANAAAGRPPKQLLWGTTQPEEHFEEMERLILAVEGLDGAEGLWAAGLEYRVVPCSKHKQHNEAQQEEEEEEEEGEDLDEYFENIDNVITEIALNDADEYSDGAERQANDVPTLVGGEKAAGVRADGSEGSSSSRSSSISHNPNAGDPNEAPPVASIPQAIAPQFSQGEEDAVVGTERQNDDLLERWNLSDDEVQQQHQHRREVRRQHRLQRHFERIRQFHCSSSQNPCPDCRTRLHHLESGQMVTAENRLQFVPDGPLYNEVTRLCQEYAQELMKAVGGLEWITICDRPGHEPIRALVDAASAAAAAKREKEEKDVDNNNNATANHAITEQEPTLLVTTGKGKVRAGIFSRSHLLTSGVEPATALPMIQEARRRGIHRVVLLDPNARGDREGMLTYETSLRSLFGSHEPSTVVVNGGTQGGGGGNSSQHANTFPEEHNDYHRHHPWLWRATRPLLYIVAHSASGAQLVRYLLGQEQEAVASAAQHKSSTGHFLLHKIAAIAFTDSTHNIQWVKKHQVLWKALEQSSSLYIRSLRQHEDAKPTGQAVKTDGHWQHRFGTVRTIWAGTTDHSLCNWEAHSHIWDHFDQFLSTSTSTTFLANA